MTTTSSFFGVGLRWSIPTTVYFAAAVGAHYATFPRFVIAGVSPSAGLGAGIVLIAAGTIVYLAALTSLRRSRRSGRLATTGLYSLVRHPLYAAAIFLIVPGVAIAFRSWLLLPMPVVAYVACRAVLPAEDRELRIRHGERYERYRERTSALFPTRALRSPGRSTASGRED